MNLGYFHTLLLDVKYDLAELNIQSLLQALVNQLQAQVNDPSNSQYQTNVGNARESLATALQESKINSLTDGAKTALREFSLGVLIPSDMLGRIDAAFVGNQITPQLALKNLQEMRREVDEGIGAINNILNGFDKLQVETDDLGVGETEISITIPRGFVHEDPVKLGEEFKKLDHLLRPFTELAAGEYLPIKVRQISSSNFLIALLILSNLDKAAKVVKAVADAIRSLIGIYKDVSEVRVMKARLKEMDGKSTAKPIAELEKFAEKQVNEGIGKVAEELVATYYTGNDAGRKAELLTHIKDSLKKMAARLDKGFDFETRAGELPSPQMEEVGDGTQRETAASAATRASLAGITEAHKEQLVFVREGEPILGLPAPEEEA